MIDMSRMTKEEFAAYCDDRARLMEGVSYPDTADALEEAARRLRNSVPRELYDKAWEECRAWRATFDPDTGKQVGDACDCRDVMLAGDAHDAARAAHAGKDSTT